MERVYSLFELVESGCSGEHPGGYEYSSYTKRVIKRDDDGIRVFGPLDFDDLPQDGWVHVDYCRCGSCR